MKMCFLAAQPRPLSRHAATLHAAGGEVHFSAVSHPDARAVSYGEALGSLVTAQASALSFVDILAAIAIASVDCPQRPTGNTCSFHIWCTRRKALVDVAFEAASYKGTIEAICRWYDPTYSTARPLSQRRATGFHILCGAPKTTVTARDIFAARGAIIRLFRDNQLLVPADAPLWLRNNCELEALAG